MTSKYRLLAYTHFSTELSSHEAEKPRGISVKAVHCLQGEGTFLRLHKFWFTVMVLLYGICTAMWPILPYGTYILPVILTLNLIIFLMVGGPVK